jgi:arabinoxylan arabinofuranohydrolase
MNKLGFNPYLPSWEYIPDGEPYVFGGRVYVYGSHDRFNGHAYCFNDYVCWSAPENDLGDWRYEGVIFKKTDEPENKDGSGCLFAPDVTVGPDGRYYLFYVLDRLPIVSVAVCDKPAGKYEFLGYVRHQDGTRLGERPGDTPQFDPGVLTEGERTYLYTGFCGPEDKTRKGPMATVLGPDMLTIIEETVTIAPSKPYAAAGSGFAAHSFFEAPSIRKVGDTYYFVYSSTLFCELCYATSKHPTKDFVFRGVIVSNNDTGIGTYKPKDKPMYYGGNNHGGMVEIAGTWHIFYHRHTNGINFSRQGCIEPISILADGSIPQVEMTSCGPNHGPLPGRGEYSAAIACNLFCGEEAAYTGWAYADHRFPKITQDGKDGDEEPGFIANMMKGAVAGFKYFDCRGVKKVSVKTRGYFKGEFELRTKWDGPALGKISASGSSLWKEHAADIAIPDGIQALYFAYVGEGQASLAAFKLE